MRTYRPLALYLHTVIVFLAILLAIVFIGSRSDKLPVPGIVFTSVFGLIYLIAEKVSNHKIKIDGYILTYSKLGRSQSVNLSELTNCKYYLYYMAMNYTAGWPSVHYVFHLYDSSGGYVTLPANYWRHRKDLCNLIANSVRNKKVSVNAKTAHKLGIKIIIPSDTTQTP